MKPLSIAGVILVLAMPTMADQRPTFKTAKAKAAQKRYESSTRQLDAAYQKKLADTRQSYAAELQSIQKEVTQAGNLEEALRIRDTIAALDRPKGEVADDSGESSQTRFTTTKAKIAQLQYENTTRAAERDHQEKLSEARQAYIGELREIQNEVTRANYLDEAVRIRDAIASIEEGARDGGDSASDEIEASEPKPAPTKAKKGHIPVEFRVECPEAVVALDEASAIDQPAFRGIKKLTLVGFHDAVDLHKTAGEPAVVKGSHAGQALVGTSDGIFIFGPYTKLEPGRYMVIYRLQPLGPAPGSGKCWLDVSDNSKTIASRWLEGAQLPQGRWVAYPVLTTISNDEPIQYRLWPQNRKLAIDRVYVFAVE